MSFIFQFFYLHVLFYLFLFIYLFFFFLLIIIRSGLLAKIRWSVYMSIIITIIIIIIIINIYSFRVFTSVLADGFSLEFEWQQVSSSLQDSSQYSGRSQ